MTFCELKLNYQMYQEKVFAQLKKILFVEAILFSTENKVGKLR